MPGVNKRVRFDPRPGSVDDEPSNAELLEISRKQMKADDDAKKDEGGFGETSGKQHTLDSDEEEEDKYGVLNMEDVEGEEESTLDHDGDTKITPFNMREEMDEGHFDSEGTFIFKRKDDEIRDAWLDNIDWGNAKSRAGSQWEKHQFGEGTATGSDDEPEEMAPVNRQEIYAEMTELLQPGETVTRALKRLGGSKKAIQARQRKWKQKDGEDAAEKTENEPNQGDPEKMLRLTELVDRLVSNGEFEAYGFTYERVRLELDKLATGGDEKPISVAQDSGLDMFSELDSEQPSVAAEDEKSSKSEPSKAPASDSTTDGPSWLLKWQDTDAAEVHGPFSSAQMEAWSDEGYFKDSGWTRRADKDEAQFYSAKRIDFGLYT